MSSMPRILLTGGAGFIGSNLAEVLLQRGAPLAIVDDLNNFYAPAWKKKNLDDIRRQGDFKFYHADISDAAAMRKAFDELRPECVAHLAARAGVRPSLEEPELYDEVHVRRPLILL